MLNSHKTPKRRKVIPFKNVFRIIVINIEFFFLALLVLELFWGNWFNSTRLNRLNIVKDAKIYLKIEELYESNTDFIYYTRDNYGLRGDYDHPSNIDILTVGGSTTDQMYIDDADTWQSIIQKNFLTMGKHINIANAGVDGQSTYGHIKNFEWWFPFIPEFSPKYVLYYVGINEFYNNLLNDNIVGKETIFTYLKDKSALFHLYRTICGAYNAMYVHKIRHRSINFNKHTLVKQPLLKNHRNLMAARIEGYEKRLRLLGEKTKGIGAIPIFVTQTSRKFKKVEGEILGISDHFSYKDEGLEYNGVDYYYMLQIVNNKTLEVCEDIGGIPIDLASNVYFDDEDFYDFFHMTPTGAEKIGDYLFESLNGYF